MRWFIIALLLLVACSPQEVEVQLPIGHEPEEFTGEPLPPEMMNFEGCVTSGGEIMNSYPRQCKTAFGEVFVEVLEKEDSGVCPTVCFPMHERQLDGTCEFVECGSGCGPDGETTFASENECLGIPPEYDSTSDPFDVEATSVEPVDTQEVVAVPDDEESASLKEFNVEAYQFAFTPDPITVQEGDTVRITFTSRDVAHGVRIPDFGVSTPEFTAGESHTVEFVADKKGEFEYKCSVYCGSGHSHMTGTLVVE